MVSSRESRERQRVGKTEGGMFPTRVSAQWRLIYDAQALMHALILASTDGQATGAAEFLSFAVR